MRVRTLRWPYPFRWAYGITDDTDLSTLESVRAVYEFCLSLGIRPTKTVWTHRAARPCGVNRALPPLPGDTLEDPEYRAYCQELSRRGVEIGLHGVSSGNNTREETRRGLERFREVFGRDPRLYVCHSLNAENPYWGESHFRSPLARRAAKLLLRRNERFHGEDPDSPYYWADLCRETIHYVRLFRTLELNVLRKNPMMPYHQHDKPGVRFWFSASAQDHELCKRVSHAALDRVAREDGAVIHYAHMHLFHGYPTESRLMPVVERALRTIGERTDVWRAGVSEILDRLLATKNVTVERRRHALVLGNPTSIPLRDFQLRADCPRLYLPGGRELLPDAESRFHLEELPAYASLPLFFTRSDAELGDPAGISAVERSRMLREEAKHLVWQHFGAFNWAREWAAKVARRR